MTTERRFISGACTECRKVGAYDETRGWSIEGYNRLDYAFCSEQCARDWEQKIILTRHHQVQ